MWQIVDIPGKKANKDSSLDTTLKKIDGKLFILMVSFTMFEKRLMLTQQIIKMTVTGNFKAKFQLVCSSGCVNDISN